MESNKKKLTLTSTDRRLLMLMNKKRIAIKNEKKLFSCFIETVQFQMKTR